MATVMFVAGVMFNSRPARTLKADVTVTLERTHDELPAIQATMAAFRKPGGTARAPDVRHGRHTGRDLCGCTPVKEGDDPARLGLDTAKLPGGWYLRARIIGDGPGLHERIGPAMQELAALAGPADPDRPLVEYYKRHGGIELWVPVSPES